MGKFDRVLLASDFDNTLVDTQSAVATESDIPPMCGRNRAALDYFIDNGGLFAIATGRAVAAFTDYAKDLPVNVPCVVANGAGLYDFREGRYLYTAFFPEEIRAHMDVMLHAFPRLTFEVYHDDRRIHAMHPNHYVLSHQHLTRTKMQPVERFDEVDFPIIKVLFEDDEPVLNSVRDFILAQPWSERYELIFSGRNLLEMTVAGATKGGMVLRLAERLGVARKDIYCIGDHNNDAPMLRVSAIPFAPANAVETMKAVPGIRLVCSAAEGAVADMIEALDQLY